MIHIGSYIGCVEHTDTSVVIALFSVTRFFISWFWYWVSTLWSSPEYTPYFLLKDLSIHFTKISPALISYKNHPRSVTFSQFFSHRRSTNERFYIETYSGCTAFHILKFALHSAHPYPDTYCHQVMAQVDVRPQYVRTSLTLEVRLKHRSSFDHIHSPTNCCLGVHPNNLLL